MARAYLDVQQFAFCPAARCDLVVPVLRWAGCCCCRALGFYAVPVGMFAFLFTDIEGSTALSQRMGGGRLRPGSGRPSWADPVCAGRERGTELNTAGDGFFAGFSSPRACVPAALEMQQALGSQAWPAGERVRVRMGVHAGEAEPTETGLERVW
jgi:class 3 adenylate cyclase